MKGLLMSRYYLDEILDGRKGFDARLYPTSVRGTIAIVDSGTFRVHGLAELVGVREISYEEFVDWHRVGPFKDSQIAPYHEGKACYAYDLRDARRLVLPARLELRDHAGMWIDIPDRVSRSFGSQRTLFRSSRPRHRPCCRRSSSRMSPRERQGRHNGQQRASRAEVQGAGEPRP